MQYLIMRLLSATDNFLVVSIIYMNLIKDGQNFAIKGKTKIKIDFHQMDVIDRLQRNKKHSDAPRYHGLGFDFTESEAEKFKIWLRGEIPYIIDEYSFDKVTRYRLRKFLDEAGAITGLHFLELPQPPKDNQSRWVLFINRRGLLPCQDYTHKSFTNRGVQRVVVGYDCAVAAGGGLAAAVLALAGVPPQHNAPNRDQYITVRTENIIPGKRHLFEALPNKDWLFHDFDQYDYHSAGHYSSYMYTVNGSATIESQHELPQEDETTFSDGDIFKVQMMYHYIQHTHKRKFNACSNIFKPGVNFSNYVPEKEKTELQPRKKPDKYLAFDKDASDVVENSDIELKSKEMLLKNVVPSLGLKRLKIKKKMKKHYIKHLSDYYTEYK